MIHGEDMPSSTGSVQSAPELKLSPGEVESAVYSGPSRSLFVTQFLSGVVVTTLGPVLDSVLHDLGIPLARGGLPALSYFCGIVIGLASLNVFLARVPVKQCLLGAVLLEATGLAAAGVLAKDLWSFAGAYFVVGLPAWVISGLSGMWISAHLRDRAAWALNLIMLSSVSGMTLTPLSIGLLLGQGVDWRTIYLGEAGFALLVAVVVSLFPLPDITGRENIRARHARAVIAHNPRLLAAIGATSFVYLGTEMSLITWLPKFETDVFAAGATWAGLTVTFYFIGQITARLIAIPLTRRLRASTLLITAAFLAAGFIAGIAVSPTQTVSLVLVLGSGLGVSASFSLVGSYSSKFPLWHAGVVYSFFQLSGGAGSMVFPYLIGPVAASHGFRVALVVTAVGFLVMAGLAYCLRLTSGENTRARGPQVRSDSPPN